MTWGGVHRARVRCLDRKGGRVSYERINYPQELDHETFLVVLA